MSLAVTQLIGFGVGGSTESSYSFRGRTYYSGGSGTTSHSFTSVDIGTAASDRVVAILLDLTHSSGVSGETLTIDGNSATLAVRSNSSGPVTTTVLFYLAYTTGSSATVAVSTSYGTYGYAISVYALYGLISGTPVTNSSSASPLSLNTNTSIGSIIIAGQAQQYDNRSWTGVTLDANGSNGNYNGSCASARATTAETPRTISASMSPVNQQSGVVGVWT